MSRASRPPLLGPEARRVCIVMLSAVGDSVHVLPVVNALKRHRPDVELSWVIQRGPLALVRGHPAVDEFVEVVPSAGGLRDLRRRLAGRRFDLVLDLQVALKGGLATALVPARAKLGFDRARARDLNWLFTTRRIPPHPRQHVQDQYFEFLDFLGVPVQPVRVATTIGAMGRSKRDRKSRCHERSSSDHGPRSHTGGSCGTPSASRNSKYWSCTCCIGCGGMRCVVKSQFASRARARSKPSLIGAGTNDVMIPALK